MGVLHNQNRGLMNEIKLAHITLEPALEAGTEAKTTEIRTLDELELALAGGGDQPPDWP